MYYKKLFATKHSRMIIDSLKTIFTLQAYNKIAHYTYESGPRKFLDKTTQKNNFNINTSYQPTEYFWLTSYGLYQKIERNSCMCTIAWFSTFLRTK